MSQILHSTLIIYFDSTDSLGIPRMQRALSQQCNEIRDPLRAPHPPVQPLIRHKRNDSSRRNSRSNGSRRRSSGGSGKPYPTTSRRCSEAVATYHATGDIEAAAAILRGDKDDVEDDDGDVTPPEKERRRMAIVVSCVAVAITILAAAMVGVTLGLSHVMDELSSKSFYLWNTGFIPQVFVGLRYGQS